MVDGRASLIALPLPQILLRLRIRTFRCPEIPLTCHFLRESCWH
jgi:hypothetical protein